MCDVTHHLLRFSAVLFGDYNESVDQLAKKPLFQGFQLCAQNFHHLDRGIRIQQVCLGQICKNYETSDDAGDLYGYHGFTTLTLMLVTFNFFSIFSAFVL